MYQYPDKSSDSHQHPQLMDPKNIHNSNLLNMLQNSITSTPQQLSKKHGNESFQKMTPANDKNNQHTSHDSAKTVSNDQQEESEYDENINYYQETCRVYMMNMLLQNHIGSINMEKQELFSKIKKLEKDMSRQKGSNLKTVVNQDLETEEHKESTLQQMENSCSQSSSVDQIHHSQVNDGKRAKQSTNNNKKGQMTQKIEGELRKHVKMEVKVE